MDLDRFLLTNQPLWDRLAHLTTRANRSAAQLSAQEIDELVRLYQRTASHLSYVRTYYQDPALTIRLTGLVASAGAIVYGTRSRTLRAVTLFFTTTFPAAVWHCRRHVAVSAVLLLAPAIAVGAWMATDDRAVEALGPPALREAYLEEDFEDYYSSQPASQFASQVTTNNIRVGFFAFAGGVFLCVPTAYVLVTNGAMLGGAGGLFVHAGQSGKFFGLILPHGLLELSAIAVAGGAGLALGWALVDPGDRKRKQALLEEGRRAAAIVLGLAATFIVAGLIEGFVTGSGLATWIRVGIGVLAEAAFVLYIIVLGRAAAEQGLTGSMGEEPVGGAGSVVAPRGQSRPVALTRK